jgi:hypothetical protein
VIVFILIQRTETRQSPGQSGNNYCICLKKNCHLFLYAASTVSNCAWISHPTQHDTAVWHDFLNAGLNLTEDHLWASFNWTHYKLQNWNSVCIENIKIASHQLKKRATFNERWSKYKINFSGVTLSSVAETFMTRQKTISFLRILLRAGSSTDH